MYIYVLFSCQLFQGLSLALISHDHFKASDWSTLVPYPTYQKSLVDRLGRALKIRSCSGLHTWIVHAWELGRVSPRDSEEPYLRSVVPDCIHGSSTCGNSEESCRPTQKSPKNKEFFRIAQMDSPPMGTRKSLVNQLGLVNWCTRQLTRRALKTRSCSRLQP